MINFPFGTNGKSIILGVPILKHNTVFSEGVECFMILLYVFISIFRIFHREFPGLP